MDHGIGELNAGALEAIPPALALKSHSLVSPWVSLAPFQAIVPLPEPRVSACEQEWELVHCLFKRTPGSQQPFVSLG